MIDSNMHAQGLGYRDPDSRRKKFLQRDDCRTLGDRVFAICTGGGAANLYVDSRWGSALRWVRNRIVIGSEWQENVLSISRSISGANTRGIVSTDALDEDALRDMVRRAEAMLLQYDQNPERYPNSFPNMPPDVHPHSHPKIWFDATYTLDADARAEVVERMATAVKGAGLISTGELNTFANGAAYLNTDQVFRYEPYTIASFSLTVRDSAGTASGWAGVDFADWSRIDADALTHVAIEKCRRSHDPVAIEPGRYAAILEPQAVANLMMPIFDQAMDRQMAEIGIGPFAVGPGQSKIGQRLFDARITITSDPMDPDLGFVPFDWSGEPYVDTTWFDSGILKQLAYARSYGLTQMNRDWALPNPRAFRMSGGTMSIDDMVKHTERGILVTRFHDPVIIDFHSMLLSLNTRDGLWLIERGKITKAIKNFHAVESPLFAFNNVQFLGVPQRVFHPDGPVVCPPITVRDFNFSAVTDAV